MLPYEVVRILQMTWKIPGSARPWHNNNWQNEKEKKQSVNACMSLWDYGLLGTFVWEKSISSSLHGGKLYFASSRWHDNGCWQLQSRGRATMEWKIVLQRTSSCAWKCCFVATVGILFNFPAIIVYWWCSKGASTWSLLPYTTNNKQLSLTNRATRMCKCNGVAVWPKTPLPMCYHAQFGLSSLKSVVIEQTPKLGSDGAPLL